MWKYVLAKRKSPMRIGIYEITKSIFCQYRIVVFCKLMIQWYENHDQATTISCNVAESSWFGIPKLMFQAPFRGLAKDCLRSTNQKR